MLAGDTTGAIADYDRAASIRYTQPVLVRMDAALRAAGRAREADGMTARKAQLMTLGYTYELSKRTTVYAFAGYASNYTLDNQFDPGNSHTTRYAMGVTHRF